MSLYTKIGIVLVIGLMLSYVAVGLVPVQHVYALSKFFNCMTEIANSHHVLTINDVNSCYHKEFHSSG